MRKQIPRSANEFAQKRWTFAAEPGMTVRGVFTLTMRIWSNRFFIQILDGLRSRTTPQIERLERPRKSRTTSDTVIPSTASKVSLNVCIGPAIEGICFSLAESAAVPNCGVRNRNAALTYLWLPALAVEIGTCSTISMPKPSRAGTRRGWLVSSRMRRRFRSDNICAPMPICRWVRR